MSKAFVLAQIKLTPMIMMLNFFEISLYTGFVFCLYLNSLRTLGSINEKLCVRWMALFLLVIFIFSFVLFLLFLLSSLVLFCVRAFLLMLEINFRLQCINICIVIYYCFSAFFLCLSPLSLSLVCILISMKTCFSRFRLAFSSGV